MHNLINLTVTKGSLHPDDLYDDMMTFLDGYREGDDEVVNGIIWMFQDECKKQREENVSKSELLPMLFEMMDSLAPIGTYFGPSIENTKVLGFWPDYEVLMSIPYILAVDLNNKEFVTLDDDDLIDYCDSEDQMLLVESPDGSIALHVKTNDGFVMAWKTTTF